MSIQIEAPQFEREKGTNKTNNKKWKERDRPIVLLRSHKETNPFPNPDYDYCLLLTSFLH